MYPIFSRVRRLKRRGFSPRTTTIPVSGWIAPVIIRMVVVLPAPLGPITPTIAPSGTANDTSLTATTSPKRWLTCSMPNAQRGAFGSGLRRSRSRQPRAVGGALAGTGCVVAG